MPRTSCIGVRRLLLAGLIAAAAAATGAAQMLTLTTTFASNNGQAGNMFDVSTINAVVIRSFDLNLDPGTWTVEVRSLPAVADTGACLYLPQAANPAAWTLDATVTGVVSAGMDLPTPLPGLDLGHTIPSGRRKAYYVTVTAGTGMNYTNGSAWNTVAAGDANLRVHQGSGVAWPFSSLFGTGPTASRIWNGSVRYTVCTAAGCPALPPEWETNSPEAALTLDGVLVAGPQASGPAETRKCWWQPGILEVRSTLGGHPFEIALAPGPAVPGSAGAPLLPSGTQVVNLDPAALAAGAVGFLNGGGPLPALAPFPGDFTLPFAAPGLDLTLTMQMGVLDPGHADLLRLSQACQLVIDATESLALGDDTFAQVQLPWCDIPAIAFYGTTYTRLFVNSNGDVSFTAGHTDFTPTPGEWTTLFPRVGVHSDLNPASGGSVVVAADAPVLAVRWLGVPEYFSGPETMTHSVRFDIASGAVSIADIQQGPGWHTDTVMGISNGALGTHPGGPASSVSWSAITGLGPLFRLPTDSWIDASVAGPIPNAAGFRNIRFANGDGSVAEACTQAPVLACAAGLGNGTACAGQTIPLAASITNLGECPQIYHWTIVPGAGAAAVTVTPASGTVGIPPLGTAHLALSATADPASAAGGRTFHLDVTGVGGGFCSDAGTVMVAIGTCSATLTSGNGCPGQTAGLTLQITNDGPCPDLYNWTASKTGGPPDVTLNPAAGAVFLGSGQTGTVTIQAAIGASSPGGTASLQAVILPVVSATGCVANAAVTVPLSSLAAGLNAGTGCPGTMVTLAATITNTGACTESVAWSVVKTGGAPDVALPPGGNLLLGPGVTATVPVPIQVAAGSPGGVAQIQLRAATRDATFLGSGAVTVPAASATVTLGNANGCPGAAPNLARSITNSGACRDTFHWAVALAGAPDVTLPVAAGNVILDPGAVMNAPLAAAIGNASPGGAKTLTLTVTCRGASFPATGQVTVPAPNLALSLGDGFGCPGGTIGIPWSVTNNGACAEIVAWTVSQTSGAAWTSISPAAGTVNVAAGATATGSVPVTVVAGSPSGSAGLQFSTTTRGQTFGDAATVSVRSAADFDFQASPNQSYGYDAVAGSSLEYVSLAAGGTTKVLVAVNGGGGGYFATSSHTSTFSVPGGSVALSGPMTEVTLNGGNFPAEWLSARLVIRAGSPTGPACSDLGVMVYRKLQVPVVTWYRIYDPLLSATLPQANPTFEDLRAAMNGVYRQAVVEVLAVDGDRSRAIAYDTNQNGHLDYYTTGANPEIAAITGAQLPGDPKIALVKSLRIHWRLAAAAPAGATTIQVVDAAALGTGSHFVGEPGGANEEVWITNVSGNTVTIQVPLVVAHPVGHTVRGSLAGISTDPQLVADTGPDLVPTVVHEMLHRSAFGGLSDVAEPDNTMFWTTQGSTGSYLRYRCVQVVDTGNGNPVPGVTEQQWNLIAR